MDNSRDFIRQKKGMKKKLGWVIFLTILMAGVFIVLFYMAPRIKFYSKIFNLNHYNEIYQSMDKIKKAAVSKKEEELTSLNKDDPRAIITDAGLAIVYTITKNEKKYEHHMSVSCYGRYTPHAVGEHFSVYIADIMSWNIQDVEFFFTETPVYHAIIELQEEEHLAWEKSSIIKPNFAAEDELRKHIQGLLEQVQFQMVILNEDDNSKGPGG
jgi:hypothetical protein